MTRLALLALELEVAGCADFQVQTIERERQAQENAAAVSRWDLFLNSRIDDLYARLAILEAHGCRGR
jgi:hypothetical protein